MHMVEFDTLCVQYELRCGGFGPDSKGQAEDHVATKPLPQGPPWDQARVPVAVHRTVERPMSLVGLKLYFNWILQVPSLELTYVTYLLPRHF